MSFHQLSPDADLLDGGWTNETGGTNLYPSISELSPNDATYIRSSDDPEGDIVRFSLANPTETVIMPVSLAYRIRGLGGPDLTVRLKEGTTVIAEWEHTALGSTYTTHTQNLTQGEFDSVTSWNDVYIEFQAGAEEGGVTLWQLSDLGTDLLLDLDASNAASVTGTSTITNVDDLSSYDNDATGTANHPSYNTTVKSFRSGLLNINNSALGSEWNAFIVANRLNITDTYRSLLYNTTAGEPYITIAQFTNNLGVWTFANNFTQAGSLTWPQNALNLVRCNRTTSNTSLSLNGGALNSTGSVTNAGVNLLGGWSDGSEIWGDVHQVVFLPNSATTDDIQRTEGFLAHKWDDILGVTTLVDALPSDHPYKSAPPTVGVDPLAVLDRTGAVILLRDGSQILLRDV